MFLAGILLGGGVAAQRAGGRGLIWHITSPVLIRKFQTDRFEVTLPIETEAAITSWFVILGTRNSTLGLFIFLSISQFS